MFKKIILPFLICFVFFNTQANIREKVKELNEEEKIILLDILHHLETCFLMNKSGDYFLPYPLIEDWKTEYFLKKLETIDNKIMLIVSEFLYGTISALEKRYDLYSPALLAFIEGKLKPEKIPDGLILQRGCFYKSFQKERENIHDPKLLKDLNPNFFFELLMTSYLVTELNNFMTCIKITMPLERYE